MSNTIADLPLTSLNDVSKWDTATLNALPVKAASEPILPAEPSTLSLALVGIGILCAYGVVKSRRRPAATVATATRKTSKPTARRAAA